jgi:hypothetical protein
LGDGTDEGGGQQQEEVESPQSLASAAAFERKRLPEEHTTSLDQQVSPALEVVSPMVLPSYRFTLPTPPFSDPTKRIENFIAAINTEAKMSLKDFREEDDG